MAHCLPVESRAKAGEPRAPDLPTASAFVTALLHSLSAHPHHIPVPSAQEHEQKQAGATASGSSASATAAAASVDGHASKDASKVLGAAAGIVKPVGTGNVLADAPEGVRKVLLTLHVLFPGELLPALDLLDRRLVTRLRVRGTRDVRGGVGGEGRWGAAKGDREDRHAHRVVGGILSDEVDESDAAAQSTSRTQDAEANSAATSAPAAVPISRHNLATSDPASRHSTPGQGSHIPAADHPPADCSGDYTVYHVRSAQHRPSRYTSSYDSTTSYEVRLRAWNCSCPAFAFSAFPSTLSEPVIPHIQIRLRDLDTLLWEKEGAPSMEERKGGEDKEGRWRFGGASLEGSGMPPVCKHLLACVLVDRCGIFRAFGDERVVGQEEAAGWAAGWGD